MKKILVFVFASLFVFLCACSPSRQNITSVSEYDAYSPLFTVKNPTDKDGHCVIFPLEKGFLYAVPSDDGAKVSYVDVASSVSLEGIYTENGFDALGDIRVFPGSEHCVLTAGKALYISDPEKSKESASIYNRIAIPESVPGDFAVYEGVALFYTDEKNDVVALEPCDFSEKYVLGKRSVLSGCETPVASSEKYLFFTKSTDTGYEKMLRLTYGTETATFVFEDGFTDIKLLGNSNILTKNGKDYKFINVKTGECIRYQVVRDYTDFSASGDLRYFAGLFEENGKQFIEVIDTDSSVPIRKVCLESFRCPGNLAVSGDGSYLLFSLTDGNGTSSNEMICYVKI